MSKNEPGGVPTMVTSGLVVREHELGGCTTDEVLSCGSMAYPGLQGLHG